MIDMSKAEDKENTNNRPIKATPDEKLENPMSQNAPKKNTPQDCKIAENRLERRKMGTNLANPDGFGDIIKQKGRKMLKK